MNKNEVDSNETAEVCNQEILTENVATESISDGKKKGFFERKFNLKKNGTTLKTEITAGITTFMAMAYILMVNADMFSNPTGEGELLGVSYGAIYIATALSAVIGTVLIGLIAKLPLAQASGMGLNAYFVYTICLTFGLSYANALVLVMFEGIVFILLTVTGLRKKVFDAIPNVLRSAIPASIGLFIAYLGLQNSGLIQGDDSTISALISFNIFSTSFDWASVMPSVVTLVGLIVIGVLTAKKVRGAVLYGVLGSTVLYYLLGFTTGMYADFFVTFSSPFVAFGEFFDQAFLTVFTDGFDFSAYLAAGNSVSSFVMVIITTTIAFCMLDMFDTIGSLYGACAKGDMLTPEGEIPNMNKALLSDAVATSIGAVCGTSIVTTFVESSAGVAEGGRTGLTSIVTGICFFIAMFLSPIAQLIPSSATATALIFVGALMMNSVKDIDWKDITVALPCFLTMIMMVLTYNISYGIGFGIISYTLIGMFTGKLKEIKIGTYIFAILFLLMFIFTH